MPNIKSSKKDVIRSKVAYEKNKADKSEMKTVIKKYEAALAGGDKAVAEVAELLERCDELAVVALVESDTRLIKDIEYIHKF